MNNLICAVRLIELPNFKARQDDSSGDLVVLEGNAKIPFDIARVFLVRASGGAIRGCHAHRQCVQFMVCSAGCIRVTCDDGAETATFTLDRPNLGLLVPPGIWAEQTYEKPHSILTVLCDRPYEEEDYIRDFEEFKAYRIKLKERE